jgi:hypothetical protein
VRHAGRHGPAHAEGHPGGAVLAPALATLPLDAPERAVASRDMLELRPALGSKQRRGVEEEELIVSTQDILSEILDEPS